MCYSFYFSSFTIGNESNDWITTDDINGNLNIKNRDECHGLNDVIVDGKCRYDDSVTVWPQSENIHNDADILSEEFHKSSWINFLSVIKSYESLHCAECGHLNRKLKYLKRKYQDKKKSGNSPKV